MAACTTKKAHNECTTPTNQAEIEQLKESHAVAVQEERQAEHFMHTTYIHMDTHSHTGLCTPLEATENC